MILARDSRHHSLILQQEPLEEHEQEQEEQPIKIEKKKIKKIKKGPIFKKVNYR